MKTKYWIIAASKDHVMKGVEGGFCQANHGKASSLKRMKKNDMVLFYSSKQTIEGKEKLQAFTAIGKVRDDEIFQFDMGNGFVPFRRKIEFIKCKDVPILPLIEKLHFIKDKQRWGYPFRFGFLEINEDDYGVISDLMS